MGAESFKVEWKDNPDTRLAAMAPIGGRAARNAATGPLQGVKDSDMGGQFNNKNAGKRGISLNIRHPKGLQIAKDLLRICNVVAEGFSPGVLDRLGFGYDVMKSIRPDIIYIQQSGMGVRHVWTDATTGHRGVRRAGRHVGTAEWRCTGGLKCSFLDWMGAYGYALALLRALYHREGAPAMAVDLTIAMKSGLFLTGATILDWSAN